MGDNNLFTMTEENKNISDNAEDEKIHDGTDLDGILELSKPAPNWIIFVFLVTYGFAIFYLIHYFGYPENGKNQTTETTGKVAPVDTVKQQAQETPGGGATTDKAEILKTGAELFTQKGCVTCHGAKGEGNNIGPNLTDNFWINGCTDEKIIAIITEGKLDKGMTPFKTLMTPEQIKIVSEYIKVGLVGSNPENAKKPQGEECKP